MSFTELVERGSGRVLEHAPFGALTTYRVGGSVRVLVNLQTFDNLEELGPLMRATGLSMYVLGNGSNLLVADEEQSVLGVTLGGEFAQLEWHDEGDGVIVIAGGGLDLPIGARRLARDGIAGFEWAVGVPGTFGGAVMMNAGGHGSDMAASLHSVELWRDGTVGWVMAEELHLGYRSSALHPDQIVLRAKLHLQRGVVERSQEQIREIVRWRREHQPGGANAGSVFRNPPGDHAGRLIEAAGCKGLRVGSAQVSEKHANFIVVDSGGRARDVFELLTTIRLRVLDQTGITLHCEHRFLGFEEPS